MDSCFLLPSGWSIPDGHGKAISVRRTAAMGDAIAGTVVADRLIEQGFKVTYACHHSFHPVLVLHPGIAELKDEKFHAQVTLDRAYEDHPQRCERSFTELFIEQANLQLGLHGILLGEANGTPRLVPKTESVLAAANFFKQHPKPWVILNPRASGYWHGRHVPNWIWAEAAAKVHGTCFWLGQDPAPAGIVDLRVRTVELLPPLIANGDLMVTVDTGPLHIAAALGKPIVAINQSSSPALHLSDQVDFELVNPSPVLDCLNCQKNVCPKNADKPPCQDINPDELALAINRKLGAITGEEVSAVIAVLNPKPEMLRRCLAAVRPQVSEIIITADRAGVVSNWVSVCQGCTVVTTRQKRIGVGRNYNHGFRHTHGRYILMLNDDVYLKPDAVARLKECMKDRVGIVGQLMHYPDGTIYHAGKVRQPNGNIGHHHLDLRKHRHTIVEPREMENTNCASALIRREAFYQVRGFDERFVMYAEDDDICMRMRQAGWKVMYTPHADGVHDEHQESKAISNRMTIMQRSNALFAQLWGKFYQHNQGNSKLGDFNYAS